MLRLLIFTRTNESLFSEDEPPFISFLLKQTAGPEQRGLLFVDSNEILLSTLDLRVSDPRAAISVLLIRFNALTPCVNPH